ncbi:helix-turn-helix domain-containing protein [Nocardia sp. NPDC005366]|uniref:MmyB family transcriptional regulator n=1 Tax=Nocardia sp. NPDC005366 TaxID=3156878 RepID=UPI0033B231B6
MTRDANSGRRPRRRRKGDPAPTSPDVPEFGYWVRRIREARNLSRPRAVKLLHTSESTLKAVENRGAPAQESLVENMVTGYGLDSEQAHHTRNLAEPPIPLPSLADLRTRIDTVGRRAKLTDLDHRGIAAAYIDPLWNVVLANEQFTELLPGLDEFDDNIALWFFHPGLPTSPAERIVVDRAEIAAYLVSALRGALGRYREAPHARGLVQDLRGAPEFTEPWDTTLSVAYGRRPDDPIHLRDPTTGDTYPEHVHLGDTPHCPEVRFCLCYREYPSDPAQP